MKLAELCQDACAVLSYAASCSVESSLQEQARLVHQSWLDQGLEARARKTNLDANQAQEGKLKQLMSQVSLIETSATSSEAKVALLAVVCAGRTLQALVGNAVRSHGETSVKQLVDDCINTRESVRTTSNTYDMKEMGAVLKKVDELSTLSERFERAPLAGARVGSAELRSEVNAFVTAAQEIANAFSDASGGLEDQLKGLGEEIERVVAAFERALSAAPKLYNLCALTSETLAEVHKHFSQTCTRDKDFSEVLPQLDGVHALWESLKLTERARVTDLDVLWYSQQTFGHLRAAAHIALDPTRDSDFIRQGKEIELGAVYEVVILANELAGVAGNQLRAHGSVTLDVLRTDLSLHCKYFDPPSRPKNRLELWRLTRRVAQVAKACSKSDRAGFASRVASREFVEEFNKVVDELQDAACVLADPDRHARIYCNGWEVDLKAVEGQLNELFKHIKNEEKQSAVKQSSLDHRCTPIGRSFKVVVLV